MARGRREHGTRAVRPVTQVEVVGVALVQGGRVLAARRSRPAELAGRWEFPGGKVEPGEDGPGALVRECREELDVGVEVGAQLGRVADERIALTLFAATVQHGVPAPGDTHDELRWLTASSLDSVDWLPLDAVLLPAVREMLRWPHARSTV